MKKVIVFDWSGVVKDAVISQLWVVNKIFNKYGIEEISLNEFKENWVQPYMAFYNKYLPDLSLEQQKMDYSESVLDANCPKSKAFEGMVELIKLLKDKGDYLVILSGDPPSTILPEITSWGLENVFDEIFIDVHDKTDILRNLIETNGFDPKNVYFVGDSNHEIEAGKQVGVNTIAVTWGFGTEQNLKLYNPDFMVHSVEELKKIL